MRFSLSLHRPLALRLLLVAALGGVAPAALALGLGELRTVSRLGDRLQVEIELFAQRDERVEAGCVRLRKPVGDDGLPWLRQGSHSIRRGTTSVLAIRADAPVFDPIIQIGVHVGCGFEVQRDYTIFLSPRQAEPELPVAARPELPPARAIRSEGRRPASHQALEQRAAIDAARTLPAAPKRVSRPSTPLPKGRAQDRLVLFADGAGGEPSLALSTALTALSQEEDGPEREALRESLRVEYRMLQALHQQALTLLETAEKLRQLEQTLSELQQRTDEIAQKGGAAAAEAARPAAPAATSAPAVSEAAVPPEAPVTKAKAGDGSWMFYTGLGLVLLLVVFWVVRRHRQRPRVEPDLSRLPPALVVDPRRGAELPAADDIDFDVGEAAPGASKIDVQFADTSPPPELVAQPSTGSTSSQFSVAAASVDEHFEINPVMELADIMLSFGRVKGAAQALQEFVDHSPEEALQPWIRLMDVYRMAGMREEFERVAANLNQYFNVEVQNWDSANPGTLVANSDLPAGAVGREEPLPIEWPSSARKAKGVEELAHIRDRVIALWGGAECEPYLQGLLRDNRGGLRTGFTIEVVDEILFLIQLQETLVKMDAEAAVKEK